MERVESPESHQAVEPQPLSLDELNSDETAGVLYNASYGGFGFSQAVCDKFDAANIRHWGMSEVERTNQAAVCIVMATPDRDCEFSSLRVEQVPKPMLNFIDIHEYDGSERVRYDWQKLYTSTLQMVKTGQLASLAEVEQCMQRVLDLSERTFDDLPLVKQNTEEGDKV